MRPHCLRIHQVRRSRRKRALPVLLAAVVVAGGCDSDTTVGHGQALERLVDSTLGLGAMQPGQEVVVLLGSVRNTSSDDILIKSVTPAEEEGVGEVASLVEIELAPRGIGDELPLGAYFTYPPVGTLSGSTEPDRREDTKPDPKDPLCGEQDVAKASDYELHPSEGPHDRAELLTWLRAERPGNALINGFRVVYEQEGILYEQVLTFSIEMRVRADADPSELSEDEKACTELAEFVLAGK